MNYGREHGSTAIMTFFCCYRARLPAYASADPQVLNMLCKIWKITDGNRHCFSRDRMLMARPQDAEPAEPAYFRTYLGMKAVQAERTTEGLEPEPKPKILSVAELQHWGS